MIPPKEFIRKIRPFSFLSEEELNILLSGLEVAVFKKDKTIFNKGESRKYVYIVFSGLVGIFDEAVAVDYVSRGEVFGIISLHDFPYVFATRALEDTVCYLIITDRFKRVFDRNERFSSFFTTFIKRRFRAFRKIATEKKMFEETSFVLDIDKIIYKEPVVCTSDATIAEVVGEMERHGIGSIVVVDEDRRPIGILTHKDLRNVVLYGDKSDPVARYMSTPVQSISIRASVFDAFSKMIDSGIDHMVVTKAGRVFGVVTRKDIRIQLEPSSSIIALFRKIVKASSVTELATILHSVRMSVAKIALTGPNFYDLTGMISSVHDALFARAIELVNQKYSLTNFAWIQMGSSGRQEQILASDQDNAIIHRGGDFTAFAAAMNEALDTIGIPRCPGDYMACNPMWNQDLSRWKDYFREWFTNPIPDHLRYLSVFLDMRRLYGNQAMFDELVESFKPHVNPKVIRLMALDAIEIEPPLGIFGIKGLHKGVDVKTYGIYPIVNGVRVLIVDHGMPHITNTRERLEALKAMGVIDRHMCNDLLESYGFLQDLRLRNHSSAILNGSTEENLIGVKQLRRVDLLILKESLKVVASFQKLLMDKYQVKRSPVYSQL